MTTVSELVSWFDQIAPISLAADWDNTGLLIGDFDAAVKKVLVCLTLTKEVAQEAIEQKVQMVVTHHPLPFKPMKTMNSGGSDGAILWQLATKGIGVYSLHTRWDDANGGINDSLLEIISAKNLGPIIPLKTNEEVKLVTFLPGDSLGKVSEALFEAGAGLIGNYKECSFITEGTGTFFGNEHANPVVGIKGQREKVVEQRLEVVCPVSRIQPVISALKKSHPYEEPAFDLVMLKPKPNDSGTGRLGLLARPTLIAHLAKKFEKALGIKGVSFAGKEDQLVSKVAVVCGSGASLMGQAFMHGAECFITGEARFHDLLSAKDQNKSILLLGHYKSERFGVEALATKLQSRFATVKVIASGSESDPLKSF
ncbi:MAG: Nif3-like dinuclear metal center hexameric protein [Planctomycetes bacterium]|nr:Nif3-like dinuclear metal center hexameric protein [Planctomycetota bacterium]NBY02997.1 Nif3-like dinuclear metal center hexameric protein [Planctomycetota bacterium]